MALSDDEMFFIRKTELAERILCSIVAAGGYNQQTGVTHFIPADIAVEQALKYAHEFLIVEARMRGTEK